jgi:CelD/BcsL family acetyltransferase involved in cellulose biosynthesis
MPFTVRVFDNFRDAKEIWKSFESETEHHVFQTFDLQQHYYECIGRPQGARPCLVYVEDDRGTPLCFLPFQIRSNHGARLLEWLGGLLFDYRAPLLSRDYARLCGESDFAEIWRRIRSSLPAFDAVDFKRMPDTVGGIPNPFVELPGAKVTNHCFQAHLPDDWDAYYASCVGAKHRWSQRRKERKLTALGPVSFEVLTDVAERRHQIDKLLALKSQRYELFGRVANDRHSVQFLKGMVSDPAVSPMTHFSVLRLGEATIAAHLGFVHNRTLYYMIPAFETVKLSKYSPGNILLLHLMKWAIENEYEVFDFAMGRAVYKTIWSDSYITLYDYWKPATLRGLAFLQARNLKRRVHGWGPDPLPDKFAGAA